MDKPQIILHIQKSVNYTLFDTKWIPSSAKFVALGNYARGSGALQIYEVSHGEVNCILDVSMPRGSLHGPANFPRQPIQNVMAVCATLSTGRMSLEEKSNGL